MSRYRKVEVRTYGDEKFRKLSPIPPCGQGLWLYLITGPHTTAIPGLFRAGKAALSEELGWKLEDFDKAFAEVFQQGMAKADWTNRVVWIPKAIRHNKPASPNVVTSWAAELDLIPECDLKAEGIKTIGEALSEMNPAFSDAFSALVKPCDESRRKPIPKACPKPSPNQQQEQEQKQEQVIEASALTAIAVPPPFITLPLNDGSEYGITDKEVREWQLLYPSCDVKQELRKYKGWAVATPHKRKTRRGILTSVNTWLAKSHDNSQRIGIGGNYGSNRAQQRTDGNIAALRRAFEDTVSENPFYISGGETGGGERIDSQAVCFDAHGLAC